VTVPAVDLSELDGVDLDALRLGAQVMRHKAELAERPRVESFFREIALTVDQEIARRRRTPDDRPLVALADLPLVGVAVPAAGPTADDRRMTADLLALLGGNDRLSPPVRNAWRVLREHVETAD
jgi:hypothetical protein